MYIPDRLFEKINNPPCTMLFVWLIHLADANGVVSASFAEIADEIGYPKTKVYRYIQTLVKMGAIGTSLERRQLRITITGHETYKRCDNTFGMKMERKWNENGTKMERNTTKKQPVTQIDTSEKKTHWNENGMKMERKWNENGTKMERKEERYFDDEYMNNAILKWLAFKREKKQTYKPRGIEMLKAKLTNLSNGDGKVAMMIVEQSMSNNYSGLFPLRKITDVSKSDIGVIVHSGQMDYSKGL